jgi:hypothetical protein
MAANAQDSLNINFSLPGDASVNITDLALGVNNEQTWAVPFTATLNGNTSNPFTVYCIDLPDSQSSGVNQNVTISSVGPSTNVSTTNPAVTNAELSQASYLIDTYGAITGSPGDGGTFDSNQAALQLAIWAVVSGDTGFGSTFSLENPLDLPFFVTLNGGLGQSTVDLADSYLANLGSNLGNGVLYEINPDPLGQSHTGQNLLGADGSPLAPEGSTVALFACGLAPLFGFKWLAARRRINS